MPITNETHKTVRHAKKIVSLTVIVLFAVSAASLSVASDVPNEETIHDYLREIQELQQHEVMDLFWSESHVKYSGFHEIISPNARHIALSKIRWQEGGFRWGHILFLTLPDGKRITEVDKIEGPHYAVSPEAISHDRVRWSPDSVPWVRMSYGGGWGEWCEFDLESGDFSESGRETIQKMLSYEPGQRPADQEGSSMPEAPVWGGDGTFYKDKHAAREAGVVQLWSPPSYGMLHQRHPGLPDKHITVEHDDVTHVYRIVTGGSFADPEAATVRHEGVTKVANVHRGHVFLTNWWKRDPNEPNNAKWPRMEQNLTSEKHVGVLPLAARYIPPHGLLYYEDGALVIYRNRKYYHKEGGVRHHELWKTRLPGHLFRRYHVLPPDDRLLLVTDAMVDGVPTIHYFYVHGLPPDERHDP